MPCKDCETCQNHEIDDSAVRGLELCVSYKLRRIIPVEFERCPWPSQRKEKKDKFDVLFENIFVPHLVSICGKTSTYESSVTKESLKAALEKAGYK